MHSVLVFPRTRARRALLSTRRITRLAARRAVDAPSSSPRAHPDGALVAIAARAQFSLLPGRVRWLQATYSISISYDSLIYKSNYRSVYDAELELDKCMEPNFTKLRWRNIANSNCI
eukprot:IDg21351t1